MPVDEEFKNAAETLNNNKYAKASLYYGHHTCKMFTDAPKWVWEQIRLNYKEVTSDLNRKLEISNSLAAYNSERKNRGMVFIQVALAAATFFFLIFPQKADAVAQLLQQLRDYLNSLF